MGPILGKRRLMGIMLGCTSRPTTSTQLRAGDGAGYASTSQRKTKTPQWSSAQSGQPTKAPHDNLRSRAAGCRGHPLPLPDTSLDMDRAPPANLHGRGHRDLRPCGLLELRDKGESTLSRVEAPDGRGGYVEAHHSGHGRGASGRGGVGRWRTTLVPVTTQT